MTRATLPVSFLLTILLCGCPPPERTATTPVATATASTVATASPTASVAEPAAPTIDTKFLPAKATPLLAGRLTIRVPAAARNIARAHSIMAAPHSVQKETRLMFDAGPERLVIMTKEMFATRGSDLAGTLAKASASDGKVVRVAVSDDKLEVYAMVPRKHDRKRAAILVYAATVAQPDGSLQSVRVFVNPAAAEDPAGCSALASKSTMPKVKPAKAMGRCATLAAAMISTLRSGNRKLDVSAGQRRLTGQYSDDHFDVTVPAAFITTLDRGPDFTVHVLRHLAPLESPGRMLLGVYVGGHPSYQVKQANAKVTTTEVDGTLFGKPIKWRTSNLSDGRIVAEVIIPHPTSKARVHVFAMGHTAAHITTLKKMAESLVPAKK